MVNRIVVDKPFLNYGHYIGESPLYSKVNNCLHWICTISKEIHRIQLLPNSSSIDNYSKAQLEEIEKSHLVIRSPDVLGTIQFTENPNKLVVAAKRGFAVADFTNLTFKYVHEFFRQSDLKLNDGIIDSHGNFIIGSMQEKIPVPFVFNNNLSRVNPVTKKIEIIATGIGMSNGLSFNSTNDKLYYVDTLSFTLWQFDYNQRTGQISNKVPYLKVSDYIPLTEVPAMDGFCMDKNNNFYIAIWGCSKILQISHSKKLLAEIVFPAQRITCPGFGGIHNNELFVTSANPKLPFPDKIDQARSDMGGALFRVKLNGVDGIVKNNIWGGKV